MEALAAKDKNVVALMQKADTLAKQFDALMARADELTKRQLELESVRERLGQVDELAKKSAWQMDTLKQSRQELEVLRKEIQDFHKSHAEVVSLRDKIGADRRAFESFSERVTAMMARAPELDGKMDAI